MRDHVFKKIQTNMWAKVSWINGRRLRQKNVDDTLRTIEKSKCRLSPAQYDVEPHRENGKVPKCNPKFEKDNLAQISHQIHQSTRQMMNFNFPVFKTSYPHCILRYRHIIRKLAHLSLFRGHFQDQELNNFWNGTHLRFPHTLGYSLIYGLSGVPNLWETL